MVDAGAVSHLEHVAENIAGDVLSYVRSHPQYAEWVKTLGEKALALLAAEAGTAL